ALGLLLELGEVNVLDAAGALDLLRRLARDDVLARLHARQRRLELEIVRDALLVGEHAPHRFGAEDIAEDIGIEQRGRHVVPETGQYEMPRFRGARHYPTNREADGRGKELWRFHLL